MKYVPFVAHVDSWKKAFSADAKTRNRARWLVNQSGQGQIEPSIQLVTPTQQVVERAKSEMEEMREKDSPEYRSKRKTNKRKKGAGIKKPKRFGFKP